MVILIISLTILLILISFFTILFVMIQDDQGEGFGLFGTSGQNPFSSGDNLLVRITGILGVIFFLLCFFVAFSISRAGANNAGSLEDTARKYNYLEDADWFLGKNDGTADSSPEASANQDEPLAASADKVLADADFSFGAGTEEASPPQSEAEVD